MWEVAGSVIGQMMAQGNYDKIAKLREEAMARFGNTNLSTLEALAKEQLGPSQLGGVKMDAGYKSTQDEALKKLMGISEAKGMDDQSVEKLNAAKQEAFGVARGMAGSATQGLAARGMLDSGARADASIRGQQAGIDREYQGSIHAASDASQRALEALMAGGKMAEGMGQNDLAQKNLAAGANDRIAQFNLGHKTEAEQALVNAKLGIAGKMNDVGEGMISDQARSADQAQRNGRMAGAAGDTAMNSVFNAANSGKKSSSLSAPPMVQASGEADQGDGNPYEWEDPYKKRDEDK